MFSTSMAALAVSSLLAAGNLVVQPTWETNYRTALTHASELHKPVAVFIADGGASKLINDGMGNDVAKLLRDGYVCLSIDTATPAGKDLAESFQLTKGIVISDRTTAKQALRHEGALSQNALKGYLERFSTVEKVSTTEHYPPVVTAPAPANYAPYYPSFPSSGGCANGRCGMAR